MIGNLPKFGLALASVFYDIIFFIQHFVLYGDKGDGVLAKRNSLKNNSDSKDQLCVSSSYSSYDSTSSIGNGNVIMINSKE